MVSSDNDHQSLSSYSNKSKSSKKSLSRPSTPTREQYEAFNRGISPFHCSPCNKRLSKAQLLVHLKNKHGVRKEVSVTCAVCLKSFDKVGSVSLHSHPDLYPCFKCASKSNPPVFPDFERLKSHLFNAHNGSLWPWICTICENISWFEDEANIHAILHSQSHEDEPLTCPRCPLEFSKRTALELRRHLTEVHLKSGTPGPAKMNDEENAVNREIATLLLNLATRSGTDTPEDLSMVKSSSNHNIMPPSSDKAIDLSAKKRDVDLKSKPSISTESNTTSSSLFNPSSLVASIGLSPMNSTHLLQNLLLGKMAQITGSSSQKPQSTPAASFSVPMLDNSATTSGSGNIPLLCGQIVAQLNGLLFLVHGLNNSKFEASLQSHLGLIYNILQDIVGLVEKVKSSPTEARISEENEKIKFHLNKAKDSTKKYSLDVESEKVNKHITEYQMALLSQGSGKAPSNLLPALKETLPVAAANSVVTLLKQQGLESLKFHRPITEETTDQEAIEVESSTSSRRRRGRPPKNNCQEFGEKRPRLSEEGLVIETPSSGLPPGQVSSANGKGNKGIRNRVFCGECVGCLKNDDCGRCRYCQDKTKFGGQNRLRQKCLHRRCQMDSHRKRSPNIINTPISNNSIPPSSGTPSLPQENPSEASTKRVEPIYSGVDLARLQNKNKVEDDSIISTKPKAIVEPLVSEPSLVITTKKEEDRETIQVPRSQERASSIDSKASSKTSDEEEDEERSKNLTLCPASRINKWKAKHEAMLKQAETKSKDDGCSIEDVPADSHETMSEDPIQSPPPHKPVTRAALLSA